MEVWEKAKHIARLTADKIKVRVGKHIFFVGSPTRYQRMLAEEIYYETLESAFEAYSEADILQILDEKGIWVPEDAERLERIQKDIENLKVLLYENRLRYTTLSNIRMGIEKSEDEVGKLLAKRHSHDYLLRLTLAQSARDKYLLGCSLTYSDGTPYWDDTEGWDTPDPYLNLILNELNKCSLSTKEVREIARTEPWTTLWEMQKHTDRIFKASPIELNDDQRTLIIWSSIYSSIREHPDNLQDSIVGDDDMIDGWMILKRREREATHVKNEGLTKNPKILAATEQFYMRPPGSMDPNAKFGSVEEVNDFLKSVNSEENLGVMKQRSELIKQKGVVKEAELPDVALQNRIEFNRKLAEQTKMKTNK
jgi:hypothetical protein